MYYELLIEQTYKTAGKGLFTIYDRKKTAYIVECKPF